MIPSFKETRKSYHKTRGDEAAPGRFLETSEEGLIALRTSEAPVIQRDTEGMESQEAVKLTDEGTLSLSDGGWCGGLLFSF
jgi:hypothetical protein